MQNSKISRFNKNFEVFWKAKFKKNNFFSNSTKEEKYKGKKLLMQIKLILLFAFCSLVLIAVAYGNEGGKAPRAPSFGKGFKKYFFFENDFINLNHGSFGATPKPVLQAQFQYQVEMESNVDRFKRYETYKLLTRTREALAKLIQADPNDVVIVENSITGVNSILRSLRCGPDDYILFPSTADDGVSIIRCNSLINNLVQKSDRIYERILWRQLLRDTNHARRAKEQGCVFVKSPQSHR